VKEDCLSIKLNGDTGVKAETFYAEDAELWLSAFENLLAGMDTARDPKSVREGYLMGGAKRGALKKMYFRLGEDRLAYYKGYNDDTPVGLVALPDGGSVCRLADETGKGMFLIAPTGDEGEAPFFCQGKDLEDTKSWVETTKHLLNTHDAQVNKDSVKEGYLTATVKGKKVIRYVIMLNDQFQFFKKRRDSSPEVQ
jgi:hypothetical protein